MTSAALAALLGTILGLAAGLVAGAVFVSRGHRDAEAAANRNRNIAWQLGRLAVASGAAPDTVERLLAGVADPAEEIEDVTETVLLPTLNSGVVR